MDIVRIVEELRVERRHIDVAMRSLEYLARGRGKRRGRPPKWMTANSQGNTEAQASGSTVSVTRRRRTFSPETRKRMAESQRRRWAAARKADPQFGKSSGTE
jgi:hypothetical protein